MREINCKVTHGNMLSYVAREERREIMVQKTSMREIAKALGVSAVTVSNALAGKTGMSEAMREKILKTADEMGYVNPRNIAAKVARDIGILIPERFFMAESYYGMFCRLLVRKLKDEGNGGLVELLSAEDESKLELRCWAGCWWKGRTSTLWEQTGVGTGSR